MQRVQLGRGPLEASRLGYGCMRIVGDGSSSDRGNGKRAVHAAFDAGYTLFDHANIYANGACESLFGELLRESPAMREQIVIVGKCGIRFAGQPGVEDPARYDFSPAHLLASVEASLGRLGVETIDLLLLHRPDYLMNVQSVVATLEKLHSSGKVAHFGVSNFSVTQLELLQSVLLEPLLVNQVEINLHNVDALENGVLDQCQRLRITPQAWCPVAGVAYPAWGNTFTPEDERRIAEELERQASRYAVAPSQVALAWLLRHPAGIVPVIGSTTPARIQAATGAPAIDYTREDWYRLLEARNGFPVP